MNPSATSNAHGASYSDSMLGANRNLREFLTFRLCDEDYGIDILRVQEIRGYESPTRMVGVPNFIKGIINLRGIIVPVVDLRIKFGMSDAKYDSLTVTIVLNIDNRIIGVVVDSVSDVVALKPTDMKPTPEFSSAISAEYIIGLCNIQSGERARMLILLDIQNLMSSADMGLIAQTIQ